MNTVLSIAGSDCSGGAGIQADLKTMLANGVYGMSVMTALTAQNTLGVTAIVHVTEEFLAQQIDAVCSDIPPDAVKIGMMPSPALAAVTADRLRFWKLRNIVVDPVMIATSGASLSSSAAVKEMCRQLFPLAALITPNIPEAQVLCGYSINSSADMEKAAREMAAQFGCAVLLKGGHSVNDASDLLCTGDTLRWFHENRIDNPNTHGTGCTLSSAIASHLAKGASLPEAVQRAKDYLSGALAAMLDLGAGNGPLDHGYVIKRRKQNASV